MPVERWLSAGLAPVSCRGRRVSDSFYAFLTRFLRLLIGGGAFFITEEKYTEWREHGDL